MNRQKTFALMGIAILEIDVQRCPLMTDALLDGDLTGSLVSCWVRARRTPAWLDQISGYFVWTSPIDKNQPVRVM